MIGMKLDIGAACSDDVALKDSGVPASRPAIRARGISKKHMLKSRKAIQALDNVSLDVPDREFLTIVGPSGCGKSTLLHLLAGLSTADAGSVELCGGQARAADLNLGYISQVDTLLPWRNVLENVEIGLELRGVPKNERRAAAEELMHRVGLRGFERSYPFELSGGMRKRVAVIRTLAYDPDIIFMDEPFVGLDVQTRDELEEDILNIWQEQRKTIVLVTHDLAEAITISDRVVLMTARPGAIKAEYDIPLPRPRSVAQTKFTGDFMQLHKMIWDDLSAEVVKASRTNAHD